MRAVMMVMVLFGFSFTANAVDACPLCKDALAANANEDVEGINFPTAMNENIYLMLGVPYLTLVVLGIMVYRGMQKNAAYLDSVQAQPDLEMHST